LERQSEFSLNAETRQLLLTMSRSTIGRCLQLALPSVENKALPW
jgi:hypothetical protein